MAKKKSRLKNNPLQLIKDIINRDDMKDIHDQPCFISPKKSMVDSDPGFDILEKIKNNEISIGESIELLKEAKTKFFSKEGLNLFSYNLRYSPPGPDKDINPHGIILLFNPPGTDGLKNAIEEHFPECKVIILTPGEKFKRSDEKSFIITPDNYDDYLQLLNIFEQENTFPAYVIHGWTGIDFPGILPGDVKRPLNLSVISLFLFFKGYITKKISSFLKIVFLHPSSGQRESPLYSASSGFLRTLYKENPHILWKTVSRDKEYLFTYTRGLWNELFGDNFLREITYKVKDTIEERYEKFVHPLKIENEKPAIRMKGVYIITGGLGGLGKILSLYLARNVKAKLVLNGRSSLNKEGNEYLKVLSQNGCKAVYIQADISTFEGANFLLKQTKAKFGKINGIIHCAGVINDDFIINKDLSEFQQVINTKAATVINIMKALGEVTLDFMVFFSSVSGTIGNPGQGDYAYGNRFLDDFALYMNSISLKEKKVDRCLSIAWPLWEDGGMNVEKEYRNKLAKDWGLTPLSIEKGLNVFSVLLESESPVGIVCYGNTRKLYECFVVNYISKIHITSSYNEDRPATAENYNESNCRNVAEKYLKKLISAQSGIKQERLHVLKPLEVYGIDSVMIVKLNSEIEKHFPHVSKTLFFEYKTIAELCEYFVQNHTDVLCEMISEEDTGVSTNDITEITEESVIKFDDDNLPRFLPELQNRKLDSINEQIAIIGVTGRYPGACDLNEFWENLKNGKDCITTIPQERWNYHSYFKQDKEDRSVIYSKWGGFLEGIDMFDPLFFKISPVQAEFIDPQERIFLECAWQTLEDAGYTPLSLENERVGVFVGLMYGEYQLFSTELKPDSLLPVSSYASIANRISYAFNFNGPSLTVDTMCSSSLTAVFLACESMIRGTSTMALVGGVNLSIHPNKYKQLSQGRFLSSDGRCRAFGEGGDGYVPGEGAGAILLKPLSKAVQDSDNILAIIRGGAINHGGKTNGYTVPNPKAQENLIVEALHKSGINPGDISYIEAHGTGTSLGDPIEVTGLKQAYRRYTNKNQYCAIGSVKSNIGHLEGAAGIASLTKVILQIRHKTIVPTLHAEPLNSNIDFSQTPFYVARRLVPWESPDTKPRIAGVSGFGAGGSNVHLIIQEYIPRNGKVRKKRETPRAAIFSAKTEKSLKDYLKQFYCFLEETSPPILETIYVLQTGREGMEYRLGFMCSSTNELKEKLGKYLDRKETGGGIFTGKQERDTTSLEKIKKEQEMVNRVLHSKDSEKLLRLWIQGVDIPWKKLYTRPYPHKISLPVYCFNRKRYWIPKDNLITGSMNASLVGIENLHPLVGWNTSGIQEFKYTNNLTSGNMIIDGCIKGDFPSLPELSVIEMLYAAGKFFGKKNIGYIKDLSWDYHVLLTKSKLPFHIRLLPDNNSSVRFWLTTEIKESEQVAAHGVFSYFKPDLLKPSDEDSLNQLKDSILQIQFDDDSKSYGNSKEFYECFQTHHYYYNSVYCNIRKLWAGEEEALGWALLPSDDVTYSYHPFLTEGIFQIIQYLISCKTQNKKSVILKYVKEVRFYDTIRRVCYIHVKINNLSPATDSGSATVRIMDNKGVSLLILDTLQFNLVNILPEEYFKHLSDDKVYDSCFYIPSREKSEIRIRGEIPSPLVIFGDCKKYPRIMNLPNTIFVEQGKFFQQDKSVFTINPDSREDCCKLFKQWENEKQQCGAVLFLWPLENKTPGEWLDKGKIRKSHFRNVDMIFSLSNYFRNQKEFLKFVFFYPCASKKINPFNGAIPGFLKSLGLLFPNTDFRSISLEGEISNIEDIILNELEETTRFRADLIIYSDGNRYLQRMKPVLLKDSFTLPLKQMGTYFITGGAGALGRFFANYLIKQFSANVILCGRSPLNPSIQKCLVELAESGGKAEYIQLDISDKKATETALKIINTKYGAISGVIHSAGSVDNYTVFEKDLSLWHENLKAKVEGTVILDELTKDIKLDFFVVFSSTSSILGDFGQGDYAYGNRFADQFIACRNELKEKRHGLSISINWPLWKSGGLHLDNEAEKLYLKSSGLHYLSNEEGLAAFNTILSNKYIQVMVLPGDRERIRGILDLAPVKQKKSYTLVNTRKTLVSNTRYKDLHFDEKLLKSLCVLAAGIMKMDTEDIDPKTNLGNYGFNSVYLSDFARIISETYNIELHPPVFFTYSTLDSLSNYLLDKYKNKIITFFNKDEKIEKEEYSNEWQETKKLQPEIKPWVRQIDNMRKQSEEIAIIGIGGIFPGSPDLTKLWKNLEKGKDLITLIPGERWDWKSIYGGPESVDGKALSKWGGFIEDFDKFDPKFFNISPREAELMDPQHRLFLETAWKTIENGGYNPISLSGCKIGVFAGVQFNDYHFLLNGAGITDTHSGTGNAHTMITNRLSFLLDFRGPSETIDTACSSSLIAVNRAIKSIQAGECEMALAGGVNLMLSPYIFVGTSQLGIISPDGKCKTFDKDANGYVRGEGVGVIFLKPLSKAKEDKDFIYAVIKGCAENHGGKASSLTAPNSEAQADVIIRACREGDISPGTISYIELHGTGTALGDPVEIEGICTAFSRLAAGREKQIMKNHYCGIGSIKTNIGHTEPASGIAGMLKVILCFLNKKIPASLNLKNLNPYINLDNTPFYIVDSCRNWVPLTSESGYPFPRRAGISSFGFGGSNIHIILEEFVNVIIPRKDIEPQLILISARNEEALRKNAEQLRNFIKDIITRKKEFQDQISSSRVDPQFVNYCKETISKILCINQEDIDPDEPMIEYGFEMVHLNAIINKINSMYHADVHIDESLMGCTINNFCFTLYKQYYPQFKSESKDEISTEESYWFKNISIKDVAFTLRTGREWMNERLAFVASHLPEFVEKLTLFLERSGNNDTLFRGNSKILDPDVGLLYSDQNGREIIESIIKKKDYQKLAILWTKGIFLDLSSLDNGHYMYRIPLPEYPFARERYWFSSDKPGAFKKTQVENRLHPVIDKNNSLLGEQKFFTSLSDGVHPVFSPVILDADSIISGTCFPEMLRFAGDVSFDGNGISLKNLRWMRPFLSFKKCTGIHTSLYSTPGGAKGEIYYISDDKKIILFQGEFFRRNNRCSFVKNIETLKSHFTPGIIPTDLYSPFNNYHKSLQGITKVWTGKEEVLASWKYPSAAGSFSEQWGFYPGIWQDAFLLGIVYYAGVGTYPIPFGITGMDLYSSPRKEGYIYLRFTGSSRREKWKIVKMDIHLLDSNGTAVASAKEVLVGGYSNSQSNADVPGKLEPIEPGNGGETLLPHVVEELGELINEILKIDKKDFSPNEEISTYGLNSLTMTEFSKKLSTMYHIEIDATIFFDLPSQTIQALAEKLLRKYKKELTAYHTGSQKSSLVSVMDLGERPDLTQPLPGIDIRVMENFGIENNEPIAIIGMSGIMPQSDDLDQFWKNLEDGKNLISEIPPDRWDWHTYFGNPAEETNKTNIKWGGFINNVDKFDAQFFGISPLEAELMDPNQRIFLQTVWHTIEDAGYTPEKLSKVKTGIYVGIATNDYQELLKDYDVEISGYTATGIAHSILVNRISYLLNFNGPSEPVDTACSSALIAIHHGVESIRNGNCDVAICGGINLILNPMLYISFSKAGMLSPDGRCKTFDAMANGYVRGEGSGAILLKPLSKAQADGDYIYAIIHEIAENHGGRASSLTAPNSVAQANLLRSVYRKAGIDPSTITYYEAHGTGTPLGDPIEINGIIQAFRDLYEDYNTSFDGFVKSCAIGSVKTNTGHLETAAGIAGVLKVLLSMKKGIIPENVHFTKLNPKIKLNNTPLYIVNKRIPWVRKKEEETGREIPRRAGVSSFGFGGANAHVVIEEYIPRLREEKLSEKTGSHLVILSARTLENLEKAARKLNEFLEETTFPLENISYTLLIGRKEMEVRLAIVTQSKEELRISLKDFLEGKEGSFITGNVKKGKHINTSPDEISKINEKIEDSFKNNDLETLAHLWTSGWSLPWGKLFENTPILKVPLPGYVFSQDRFWIPQSAEKKKNSLVLSKLHPMVHKNISTLREEKFEASVDGSEFFLVDHIIQGNKVLPGVAYLEMARTSGEIALEQPVKIIQNVIWANPIIVKDNKIKIHISLIPGDKGISFEIKSFSKQTFVSHSSGVLKWGEPLAGERIDLEEIRGRLTKKIEAVEFYDLYKEIGITYGENFRGVKEILYSQKEALSRLIFPAVCPYRLGDFVLHPSLMDGAFQSVIMINLEMNDQNDTPFLPLTLDSLEIYSPLEEECFVYVQYNEDAAGGKIRKFNIYMVNNSGDILLRMIDFSVKEIKAPSRRESIYYKIQWTPEKQKKNFANFKGKSLLLFDTDDDFYHELLNDTSAPRPILVLPGDSFQSRPKGGFELTPGSFEDFSSLVKIVKDKFPDYIVFRWNLNNKNGEDHLEDSLNKGFYSFIALAKGILIHKVNKPVILINLYDHPSITSESLGGTFKTFVLENKNLLFKNVGVDQENKLKDIIINELFSPNSLADHEVLYINNTRYRKELSLYLKEEIESSEKVDIKENGVYLITGGLGGLGVFFTQKLAAQINGIIVLIGRSPLNSERRKILDSLNKHKAKVVYYPADVSDEIQVKKLVQRIKETHGPINGLIHSAGVIKDSFVIKKTREEIESVFAPKIFGTVNLAKALENDFLVFFIVFSSATSVLGNIGQSDYAYANGFMNAFIKERVKQRGKRIAILWNLLEIGGMEVNAEIARYYQEKYGLFPIPGESAYSGFKAALSCSGKDITIFYGEKHKINRMLHPPEVEEKPELEQIADEKIDSASTDLLDRNTEKFLKEILSKATKLPVHKIHINEALERYGIDSLLIMTLTRDLEHFFGELSKTLFFEYQTLKELKDYFLENHSDTLSKLFWKNKDTPPPGQKGVKEISSSVDSLSAKNPIARFITSAEKAPVQIDERIAIIGIDGRFPLAEDLIQFWENLKAGKDCIIEIPRDRWNHDEYFSPDKTQKGKTYSKWGGFIKDVDKFDPLFFNITPREACFMDPQERIFLESVWKTIEDAGYTPGSLHPYRVGIFAGVMYSHYQLFAVEESLKRENIALGFSYASIANRVSYLLDFHGPSLTLDTMCSSALTSIHLACESIIRGDSDICIAGGVNISIHPNKYIMLSSGNYAASDGRCRAFGEGGDGYVPGEGVGAIMLKHLSKAVEDHDHIYAVIRATTVNHGGKTNGFSVPNPRAQADLIDNALKKASINPRHINYIETHGTGTALGDPIEVNSLTRVFRKYTSDKQYCPIGSVKANIGHLESAAAIAGIAKVLLQLKYKKFVPSIHSDTLNPNINFVDSPFFVQHDFDSWPKPEIKEQGSKKQIPRLALLNAFGAGGSNAHIILEEYEMHYANSDDSSRIVLLSAREQEILKVYAKNMAFYLQYHLRMGEEIKSSEFDPGTMWGYSLKNIAYTLQTGRKAHEYRLAIIVSSVKELIENLKTFANSSSIPENCFIGNTEDNRVSLILNDEDGQDIIMKWAEKEKFEKIAGAWVSGFNVDWELLYNDDKPFKVSLPAYPFARERYWISRTYDKQIKQDILPFQMLHPLLDRIDQTLSFGKGLVVTKTFNPLDRVLAHHRVNKVSVLPGVCHLEMAFSALSKITQKEGVVIREVYFLKPLVVNEKQTKTFLYLRSMNDHYDFTIRGKAKEEIFSKGQLHFSSQAKKQQLLDIEKIKKGKNEIEPARLYNFFRKRNIVHHSYFQPVKKLWAAPGEAVSYLENPAGFEAELKEFYLHPSLMDGALQTIAAISIIQGIGNESYLPFSLESLEFSSDLPPRCYAYVKESGTNKFNILITNEKGLVCVKIKNLVIRPLKDNMEFFFYRPGWKFINRPDKTAASGIPGQGKLLILSLTCKETIEKWITPLYGDNSFIRVFPGKENKKVNDNCFEINSTDPDAFRKINTQLKNITHICLILLPEDGVISNFKVLKQSQDQGVLTLFRLLKLFYSPGKMNKTLEVFILTKGIFSISCDTFHSPAFTSLAGLADVAEKEYPDLNLRLVDISYPVKNPEIYFKQIYQEAFSGNETITAYRGYKRFVRGIDWIKLPSFRESLFRPRGLYIILGGAGGIGFELGKYLSENYQAIVILLGRSIPDRKINEKEETITRLGGRGVYLQVDATQGEALKECIKNIKSSYGQIHGVFHSAIVLRDMTIARMSEDDFRAPLLPKVDGTYNLFEAVKDEPLDFMIFFSSTQAFAPNPGQSNYAAGCSFKDAYACYLNRISPFPVKIVNWGFWGSVGIVASKEYNARLASMGIFSIEPGEGMKAIERILTSPFDHVMAMKASKDVFTSMGVDYKRQLRIKDYESNVKLEDFFPYNPSLEYDLTGTKEFQRYQRCLLLKTFREMGVLTKIGQEYELEELKKQLNIIPKYDRLYNALLDILADEGFINLEGRKITVLSAGVEESLLKEINKAPEIRIKLMEKSKDLIPLMKLFSACIDKFILIIKGEIPATDVMFPNSSMELVEGIYKGNPIADYCNQLIVENLFNYLKERIKGLKDGEKINILEIGAGTGGTSARIFNRIKEFSDYVHYLYTDISPAFLQFGRNQYGIYHDYIEFQFLDISGDLTLQKMKPGEYDVAIATNVLHATSNLNVSLRNINALLKKGGWLLINEATAVQDFLTLTFGLLDGWWHYEDTDNRLRNAPLLDVALWKEVLTYEGFGACSILGNLKDPGDTLFQNVIIAESGSVYNCVLEDEKKTPSLEEKRILKRKEKTKITLKEKDKQIRVTSKQNTIINTESELQDRGYSTPSSEIPAVSKESIKEVIINSISESLGIPLEKINHFKAFSDYGVDSIIGVELINKINSTFGIVMRTTVLFDYSTIEELGTYIFNEFGEKISRQGKDIYPVPEEDYSELFSENMNEIKETPEKYEDENINLYEEDVFIEEGESEDDEFESLLSPQNITEKNNSYSIQGDKEEIITRIVDAVGESLGIPPEKVNHKKPFSEFGIDSIVGVEFINQINKIFGIILKTTALFDYTTIDELGEYIFNKYGDQLKKRKAESPAYEEKAHTGGKEYQEENDEQLLSLLNSLASGDIDINYVESIIEEEI